MFTPEEIEEHLARVENERLQRAMDAMDVYDPELDDHAAPAAEARRFEFVKELLYRSGARDVVKAGAGRQAGSPDREVLAGPVESASPSTIPRTGSAC